MLFEGDLCCETVETPAIIVPVIKMDKQIIIQTVKHARLELAKYPVELVYLHGSVALGNATSLSDIDLAVVVEKSAGPQDYLDLEMELEVFFCRLLKTEKADVRIINQAPLGFKGQVLTSGILLYSKDENFRVEFETSTRSNYFDFLPVIRQMSSAFFEKLNRKQHG